MMNLLSAVAYLFAALVLAAIVLVAIVLVGVDCRHAIRVGDVCGVAFDVMLTIALAGMLAVLVCASVELFNSTTDEDDDEDSIDEHLADLFDDEEDDEDEDDDTDEDEDEDDSLTDDMGPRPTGIYAKVKRDPHTFATMLAVSDGHQETILALCDEEASAIADALNQGADRQSFDYIIPVK